MDALGYDRVECPNCGWLVFVEVHGHYQCSKCHRVIEDCCEGERQTHTIPVPEVTVFVEE